MNEYFEKGERCGKDILEFPINISQTKRKTTNLFFKYSRIVRFETKDKQFRLVVREW